MKMIMKKKLYLGLMVMSSLVLAGCWPFASHAKKADLVIINVLDAADFQDCHIQGSINIPFNDFEDAIPSLEKQNHYVIYCTNYMCMSSSFCAKLLIDAGFEHVWAYEGGTVEWYQMGYPVQGPAKMDYLQDDNEDFGDDVHIVPVLKAQELLTKIEEFASEK